jgi:hypothetical protein
LPFLNSYTEKELKNMNENGARYHPVETGAKKQMYDKQNQVLKRYKDRYGFLSYFPVKVPLPPFGPTTTFLLLDLVGLLVALKL